MIFRHSYEITRDRLNSDGSVKLSTLLYFVQRAAGGHCAQLKLDWETLSAKGLFWAVIRHRVQITRMPTPGEILTVETWPMPTTRSFYPRAAVAYDETGKEVFRAISIWVLMDAKTRNMVLPGKSGIVVNGILRGNELELPASISPQKLENAASRQVSQEDLDKNNHMTNTRYLDWVEDLLPTSFFSLHPPKEFTICYLAEALNNQKISLSWGYNQEHCLQIEGQRNQEDAPEKTNRIFAAKLVF